MHIIYINKVRIVSDPVCSDLFMHAAKRNTCAKFHQDSLNTERLICLATDGHWDRRTCGQTDRASSISHLMVIQNIYTKLYGIRDISLGALLLLVRTHIPPARVSQIRNQKRRRGLHSLYPVDH